MQKNNWSTLGSVTLFLGALAHLIVVDFCVMVAKGDSLQTSPHAFLHTLHTFTINWGVLGQTNVFNMVSGFSLWAVTGMLVAGVFNLLIFRHLPHGHTLRIKSLMLSLVFSILFLALASFFFIYPAALGGVLAVVFFILALAKEKKKV